MDQMMNIVIVGHVDHGKSTIIGRLLADTHSLPQGKLEQVRENCLRHSKPFEYAFLIDALKDEQAQGITIDSARVFFKSEKRRYIIIDAPGHIDFLKNMITGAARAEAALLVIDAQEGIQENSRRHGYVLSMLGIKQIAVLINKMDLIDYREDVYQQIVKDYTQFLSELGVEGACFIPVSGQKGDFVAEKSEALAWYQGQTVLETLDDFKKEKDTTEKPFRMPVQGIYKFTNFGDSRRIVAGTVASGSLKVGDEIIVYPSGKKSNVKSIEAFQSPEKESIRAGEATGFTLTEQIYVKRGEVVVRSDQTLPQVATRLNVTIFWLSDDPMIKNREYLLKIGTTRVIAKLEGIERIMNSSDLSYRQQVDQIQLYEVAECILHLNQPIAFDVSGGLLQMQRFVIVYNYHICGGGIIQAKVEDKQDWVYDSVRLRNYRWIKSNISRDQRAERYCQKPVLILITGDTKTPRKEIARSLEEQLFQEGKFVYYLGIGSVIYGLDADLKDQEGKHEEHLRRFGEVANILLDSGPILIVSARTLDQYDLDIIKASLDLESIEVVWVGDNESTDIHYDIKIQDNQNVSEAVGEIKSVLQKKGFIFKAI